MANSKILVDIVPSKDILEKVNYLTGEFSCSVKVLKKSIDECREAMIKFVDASKELEKFGINIMKDK